MVRATAVVAIAVLASGCSRSGDDTVSSATTAGPSGTTAAVATTAANRCASEPLQATEVGVTATDITVTVMADTGSPLAPGLFQGNVDALKAFETFVNANGGIGCRKLKVRSFDSQLKADEAKNGIIDACGTSFAMVGGNALFNPDPTPMTNCVDKAGKATGLPDVAALAADVNEQCAPTAYIVQAIAEKCPVASGARPILAGIGPLKFLLQQEPGLHGIYLIPGDLPTTVQGSVAAIKATEEAGVKIDAARKVSGRDAQPSYTPRVQLAKQFGSTFVQNGSNDVAMIRMRKEANAQGLTTVKVWSCSIACYTRAFLSQGGSDVEGTYVAMNFLPFEEADANAAVKAYVDAVGGLSKADSFGANAWQAALAFKQAVDGVVAKDGPNGLTRANLLTALAGIKDFDADGFLGKKSLKGEGALSPCYLMMQVQNGKFVRVHPTEPGTMDCDPANVITVTVDPVAGANAFQ